jgi:23S rRNA pseudouridine2457 synthase
MPRPTSRLILFNKPFGVLSQFSGPPGDSPEPPPATLARYIDIPDVYPAGRLDKDSEGLMLLTDDGVLQQRITAPRHKLWKLYWVQVEGLPTDAQLAALRAGVALQDGPTRPARVRRIAPPDLWPRDPPVRYRKSVPDAWLELAIREGRNRQVRRMTAAVGLPTLRLVRVAVGDWRLDGLLPGAYRELTVPAPRTRPGHRPAPRRRR